MSINEFNFDDIEFLLKTENLCIVRTSNLLPTLQLMQNGGWKIRDLVADDTDGKEFNILTYYKPKECTNNM